jgi:capping protein (actin filament) muscle Z-line, alpha
VRFEDLRAHVEVASDVKCLFLFLFRSGRWRSEYAVDLTEGKVEGKIFINVHYYEQGNVQLSTTHSISLALPPSITSSPQPSSASKILALIEEEEGRYQQSLNDVYHEMGEKTFKSLRRALPLTRQKMDWDRVRFGALVKRGLHIDRAVLLQVMGYKLGAELGASKGGLGEA